MCPNEQWLNARRRWNSRQAHVGMKITPLRGRMSAWQILCLSFHLALQVLCAVEDLASAATKPVRSRPDQQHSLELPIGFLTPLLYGWGVQLYKVFIMLEAALCASGSSNFPHLCSDLIITSAGTRILTPRLRMLSFQAYCLHLGRRNMTVAKPLDEPSDQRTFWWVICRSLYPRQQVQCGKVTCLYAELLLPAYKHMACFTFQAAASVTSMVL
jgi:hypothetical protein